MKMSFTFILLTSLLCSIYYEIPAKDVDKEYNRKTSFTGPSAWIDEDKDCQNTRAEVLIEESLTPIIKFRKNKRCVVDSGIFYDLYSGELHYAANDMDIEHVVALKDAWESGAQSWSPERRKAFANYLKDEDHLMAVSKGENRSKGAKGPDEYLPPNKLFVKEYCRRYIRIKVKWNLTVTREQLITLQKVLGVEQIIYPKVR